MERERENREERRERREKVSVLVGAGANEWMGGRRDKMSGYTSKRNTCTLIGVNEPDVQVNSNGWLSFDLPYLEGKTKQMDCGRKGGRDGFEWMGGVERGRRRKGKRERERARKIGMNAGREREKKEKLLNNDWKQRRNQ